MGCMHETQDLSEDMSQEKLKARSHSAPFILARPALGVPEGVGKSCIACQLGTKCDAAYVSSRILKCYKQRC